MRPRIRIEPWGEEDLPLLRRCFGDPEMTKHLGGPESEEKLAERQERFEEPGSNQFRIVDETTREGVGWVGFWEHDPDGEEIYEIGWAVVRAFHGRGFAGSAAREAIEIARAEGKHRFLHAYPSVENAPSNAVCRKLGFTLLGPCEYEYPKGHQRKGNDWRLDLSAG
jgi:RimJ/RimL family protein N-acetyltransferase